MNAGAAISFPQLIQSQRQSRGHPRPRPAVTLVQQHSVARQTTSRLLQNSCGSRHLSFFSHPTRNDAQRDAVASGQRRDDGRGEKTRCPPEGCGEIERWAASHRLDVGSTTPAPTSLPALNFRSHRDLTEFFNSLLAPVAPNNPDQQHCQPKCRECWQPHAGTKYLTSHNLSKVAKNANTKL